MRLLITKMSRQRLRLLLAGICLLSLMPRLVQAGSNNACFVTSPPGCYVPPNLFRVPGADQPATAWATTRTDWSRDLAGANLVGRAEQRVRQMLGASAAIQLVNSDFATFATPGNTQLAYTSSGDPTFNIVIGDADATNAQTWSLPTDLTFQLDQVRRDDFITPGSVPVALRLNGATHASKYIAGNRLFTSFHQYQLGSSAVNYLGYSLDRKVGADFETASNTTFAPLPLQLGSQFTSKRITDDPGDDLQVIETDTIDYDGFGTLNTPNGSFQALRFTIRGAIRYYDTTGGGTPTDDDLFFEEPIQRVGWVTKQGLLVQANYADYNPITKAATLNHVSYSVIVPTSSLSPSFNNSTCNCNR